MKIGEIEIGYVTDIAVPYQKEIDKVQSLLQLRKVTQKYYPFAWDADAKVEEMQDADFARFKKEVALERKGKFKESHMDFTATILIPEPMLAFGMVTTKFHVPDGCAVIRMFEEGLLKLENGKVIVNERMKHK